MTKFTVVYFAQERKTAFKPANLATFTIAKSLICLKFYISLKKYTFLVRWGYVQSAVHITTRLIFFAELTRSTKIPSNKKTITSAWKQKFRGKVIEYEYHMLWFAPQAFIFSENMSDGYMSRQRDMLWYFLLKKEKQLLNQQIEKHLRLLST